VLPFSHLWPSTAILLLAMAVAFHTHLSKKRKKHACTAQLFEEHLLIWWGAWLLALV